MGFSPNAIFIAAGYLRIMSSTQSPYSFIATNVPPSTFAEPGPVTAVVTPPPIALPNASSRGLMPSMARISGVTGPEYSFVSLPSQRLASSCMPMWQCASTKPGVTMQPAASMISVPAGTSRFCPTATILPPSMRICPFSMSPPVIVLTKPP